MLGRLALVAVLFSPAMAVAQEAVPESPTDEEARVHFQSGRSYFDRGRYEQALAEFQQAYELSPRPALLYNLYLAQERLGRLDDAARSLEQFVEHAPAEEREVLAQRLASLRERITRRDADAAAARQGSARSGPTPTPTPTSRSSGPGTAAIVAFVVGGVGLATFAGMAIASEIEDGDLASRCGADAGSACSDDDVSGLRTFNTIADIGLGVAAAGAIAGVIFWLAGVGVDDGAPETAVTLMPGGGSVLLRGRF